MTDYPLRTLSDNGHLLGLACVTTDLVGQACHLQETSRTAYRFEAVELKEIRAKLTA